MKSTSYQSSELSMKRPERRYERHFGVLSVNFEHVPTFC